MNKVKPKPPTKTTPVPPRAERSLIAAHALCDERAVKRAYEGSGVRPLTLRSIKEAARVLGKTAPPEPKDRS